MALYSLLDMAGCGRVAFHYGDDLSLEKHIYFDKAYDIHGQYSQCDVCSSCGRPLKPENIRIDWFVAEVVH
jgi:hypothetical protein